MSEALVPVVDRREIAQPGAAAVALPEVIVDAGSAAVERFLEFFAAAIANDRTRAAYGQAAGQFLGWCGARGLGLRAIAPLHVAAYIRTHPGSVPTVKQHLAAIRALLDWLVVHQVLPVNPAASVRGPKHVVTKGATPVLTPAETRSLLDRIDTGTLVGLRDRALLSVLVYSFARVSAAVGMRRRDYFRQGVRLMQRSGVQVSRLGSITTQRSRASMASRSSLPSSRRTCWPTIVSPPPMSFASAAIQASRCFSRPRWDRSTGVSKGAWPPGGVPDWSMRQNCEVLHWVLLPAGRLPDVALDHDALDLVERDRVRRPVVQLRRLRRRVPGDPLRVLERPPVR